MTIKNFESLIREFDKLFKIRDVIQKDVGRRGLATDPVRNLINTCPDDFAFACHSIAAHSRRAVALLTGFFIPDAQPPAGETDGPLGVLFLARCLATLGIPTAVLTDGFCRNAFVAGLEDCGLAQSTILFDLPANRDDWSDFVPNVWLPFARDKFRLTHLVAVERPGPSHTFESFRKQISNPDELRELTPLFLKEVPPEHQDRCHRASGIDITPLVSPAHLLLESAKENIPGLTTIGIGDGGNEVGMGKIPWDVIRRNIPNGARIASRVATDHLIVCGVSNWGAYALAAGLFLLRGVQGNRELFSADREQQLLQLMVEKGPLVDGVLKEPRVSVDGLPLEQYLEPLRQMAHLIGV